MSLNKLERDVTAETKINGVTTTIKSSLPRASSRQSTYSAAAWTVIASNTDNWWKHKYVVSKDGTAYKWYTQKSSSIYKNTNETSGNKAELNGFKEAIDSCKSAQTGAIAAVGFATASAIAGALYGASTVTLSIIIGLVVAAGGLATAAYYFWDAYQWIKDADYHYARY